jgi:hypothetical protein
MSRLVLQAYLELVRVDVWLARQNFAALYRMVRESPARNSMSHKSTQQICAAVDVACIWYWKQVLCLQRAVATTCLLRAHGITATMVIGGQQMPFKAHAWVEVGGSVVNDKPYIREIYAVLDQC